MKDLRQLIASFEQKAQQDDYAIVSKEDLQIAVKALKIYQNYCDRSVSELLTPTRVSLNSADYCSTNR